MLKTHRLGPHRRPRASRPTKERHQRTGSQTGTRLCLVQRSPLRRAHTYNWDMSHVLSLFVIVADKSDISLTGSHLRFIYTE